MLSELQNECINCPIRHVSVFSELRVEDVNLLRLKKACLTFSAGDLIFKEGQFPTGMFIVSTGKVKIFKTGTEGREQILRFAREGDIIGYRSLLGRDHYHCSAMAIGEVQICFMPMDLILLLIEKNFHLGMRFMRQLALDLKHAEERTLQIAQKHVRERIAEALLLLVETYGFEEDRITLSVRLSREEIAGIAGTVRETAIRLLSEFNAAGIIRLNGRKIVINDMNKLAGIANINA